MPSSSCSFGGPADREQAAGRGLRRHDSVLLPEPSSASCGPSSVPHDPAHTSSCACSARAEADANKSPEKEKEEAPAVCAKKKLKRHLVIQVTDTGEVEVDGELLLDEGGARGSGFHRFARGPRPPSQPPRQITSMMEVPPPPRAAGGKTARGLTPRVSWYCLFVVNVSVCMFKINLTS